MRSLCPLVMIVLLASTPIDSAIGQGAGIVPADADTVLHVPNPRTALLLGLIPGGGQIYNRDWLKAILVVAAEGYYLTLFQQNRDKYDNYDDFNPPLGQPQDHYLELRNRYAWRAFFVYLLSLMDGYVDAHLSTFPPDTANQALPHTTRSTEENP
ncbi:MAG: hypothetical protein JSW54_02855 [Fidelibacterota bacterium]|nr:MAG: hypothetical protein JSW54_02855 [Candidatus Neomarinimicrobiota bacterium]